MKTQRTKIADSKYPSDFKEVFKQYLLRNKLIKNYNSNESNILKGKMHEKIE